MAARGSIAKTNVIKRIEETFREDFIQVDGSKIYVWADDGGERVQIAMALTCPKNWVENTTSIGGTGEINFAEADTAPAQISNTEQKNIEELMKRLNL